LLGLIYLSSNNSNDSTCIITNVNNSTYITVLVVVVKLLYWFDSIQQQHYYGGVLALDHLKTFSQYHFNCGSVLYTCGEPIRAENECPILGTDPELIKQGSPESCTTLIDIARKPTKDIYAALCYGSTDSKNVISYNKYDSNGVNGKKCNEELGCLSCWDAKFIDLYGGVKENVKSIAETLLENDAAAASDNTPRAVRMMQ
jgi:hypothetical protein